MRNIHLVSNNQYAFEIINKLFNKNNTYNHQYELQIQPIDCGFACCVESMLHMIEQIKTNNSNVDFNDIIMISVINDFEKICDQYFEKINVRIEFNHFVGISSSQKYVLTKEQSQFEKQNLITHQHNYKIIGHDTKNEMFLSVDYYEKQLTKTILSAYKSLLIQMDKSFANNVGEKYTDYGINCILTDNLQIHQRFITMSYILHQGINSVEIDPNHIARHKKHNNHMRILLVSSSSKKYIEKVKSILNSICESLQINYELFIT